MRKFEKFPHFSFFSHTFVFSIDLHALAAYVSSRSKSHWCSCHVSHLSKNISVSSVLLKHIDFNLFFSLICQDLFNLIADNNDCIDERRLGLLIYDCLRLPKLLGEVAAFGGTNVEPSVRSCLEMANSPPDGITAHQVLNWIRAEPQSLVWMVVLHRFRLAEKSRHPAKCNHCRCYPIVGFRYRCLKCFNFDLCQNCYLSDKVVKKHKPS